MAMTYAEWLAANPLPYDLQAFVDQSNEQYAGMQYNDRPQEFFDQYEMMRRANAEAQAQYYIQNPDVYLDPAVMAFNPFITNSGMPWYVSGPGGTYTTEAIGTSPPATDWYAEAAAGNPVIGPAVTPGMTATEYNQYNRNNPTSVEPGSTLEQQFVQQTIPNWTYQPPTVLAYDPGQGLPPAPTNNTATDANLAVGQGLTNLGQAVSNPQAGTIQNFWDTDSPYAGGGNTQNPFSVTPQGGNMEDLFKQWFQQTYGSTYGLD